jgi:hypothetical protein
MPQTNSKDEDRMAGIARKEWLDRLHGLVADVENWVVEQGWSTRRIEKPMHDSHLGSYSAPALLMQEGTVRVLLDPIAASAPGAEGVVDLYLMPAYDDIASLYFCDGRWRLHYAPAAGSTPVAQQDAPSPPLTKKRLRLVLEEMQKHAAASV